MPTGHYLRKPKVHMQHRNKSVDEELQILEKNIFRIPESGCWLWIGSRNRYGHGALNRSLNGISKKYLAHRYVYELLVGKIKNGLRLDHLCKVECCVNPRHLEPVTPSENVARMRHKQNMDWKKNRYWSMSVEDHFDKKTIPVTESGCLLWIGYRNDKGYGQITFRGKKFYAHRLAWEAAYGPIPIDMCVLHKCDIPECVNKNHLFLGTLLDNNADMVKKGRYNKKLIDKDVLAIRSDNRTLASIADDYGVSLSTISSIKRRISRMYVK